MAWCRLDGPTLFLGSSGYLHAGFDLQELREFSRLSAAHLPRRLLYVPWSQGQCEDDLDDEGARGE